MKNDGSANGYDRSGTILDYIPNIAYGSMGFVENRASQCSEEKYNAETDLINEQIDEILRTTSLTRALTLNVRGVLIHFRCFSASD